MAQRGGKRPGAGRKKGQVSAAKRALSEMAQEHGEMALQVLVDVARNGDSASARVSAATALLDRGWGKPHQSVEHTGKDGGAIKAKITLTFD